MRKKKSFLFGLILIGTILSVLTVKANEKYSAEEEQIQETIIAYFEARYRSIGTLKFENLRAW